MFIYDDVILESKAGETHLYIAKPIGWLGKAGEPNVADVAVANNVARKVELHARSTMVNLAMGDGINFRLPLADRTTMLRGYGAGLAIVGASANEKSLYFPKRDLGAPGDRLVWDVCAGRSTRRNESSSWLERMLAEGVEELTFVTAYGKVVVPRLVGMEGLSSNAFAKFDPAKIVEDNVAVLSGERYGVDVRGVEIRNFCYLPPMNAVVVHEEMFDGSEIVFRAGFGVEPKFSGLELFGYGVLDVSGSEAVWDTEEIFPGKFAEREVHRISTRGEVVVFKNGRLLRSSSVSGEVNRRMDEKVEHEARVTRGEIVERKGLIPIPDYSASIKADKLTKANAWPWDDDVMALGAIKFGSL